MPVVLGVESAGSVASRSAAAALVVLPLAGSGCVYASPEYVGVGVYTIRGESPAPGVRAGSAEGWGMLFRPDGVSLGYARSSVVLMDESAPGFRVRGPDYELAIGTPAEDWARAGLDTSAELRVPTPLNVIAPGSETTVRPPAVPGPVVPDPRSQRRRR